MTAFLPPNLLKLFEPRPPLEYVEPPLHRELPPYTGIAGYVDLFEDPNEAKKDENYTPFETVETREQRIDRKKKVKEERAAKLVAKRKETWDPHNETDKHTSNPYKTLFVARMSYETTEDTLRDAYEPYGPIRRVVIVKTPEGQSRGYGFIEFEHERDMKAAYKQGDAKKIDGKRVLVDVERGRTVENWRPRKLGGGLGGRREKRRGQPNVPLGGRSPPRAPARSYAAAGPPPGRPPYADRAPPRGSYGGGYGGRDERRRDDRGYDYDRRRSRDSREHDYDRRRSSRDDRGYDDRRERRSSRDDRRRY